MHVWELEKSVGEIDSSTHNATGAGWDKSWCANFNQELTWKLTRRKGGRGVRETPYG